MKRAKLFLCALLLALLVLTGCSLTKSTEELRLESVYEIVGYKYVFTLSGDEIETAFTDWYSDEELEIMALDLAKLLPLKAKGEVAGYGLIKVEAKRNIKADEFESFVEKAEEYIYKQIYLDCTP